MPNPTKKVLDSIPTRNNQIKKLTQKKLFNTKPLSRPSAVDSVAVKMYDGSNTKSVTDIYQGVNKKYGPQAVKGIINSNRTHQQIINNPNTGIKKTKETFSGRARYYNQS